MGIVILIGVVVLALYIIGNGGARTAAQTVYAGQKVATATPKVAAKTLTAGSAATKVGAQALSKATSTVVATAKVKAAEAKTQGQGRFHAFHALYLEEQERLKNSQTSNVTHIGKAS
jgi:hypothetical protein